MADEPPPSIASPLPSSTPPPPPPQSDTEELPVVLVLPPPPPPEQTPAAEVSPDEPSAAAPPEQTPAAEVSPDDSSAAEPPTSAVKVASSSKSKSVLEMMEKEEAAAATDVKSVKSVVIREELAAGDSDDKLVRGNNVPPQSLVSFKEESNRVTDLSDSERKALDEFKKSVHEALETEEPATAAAAEVSIWGIPLLKDDRSDVVLLKFLRARDFKVKEALTMLKNTIRWRKEFRIDELVEEEDLLGDDLEKVMFMHGHDRDCHPVCYNVFGEFQNKELYQKTFSDEEKRMKFLRWRIQCLEKSVRSLDFVPGGVSTIFQVNDLKNSPGLGKQELRLATKQALQLLQDNYPEFVAKQVFINVPWWYYAFYTMMSPFMTQRTKSKFVFASPARSPETLFKYIPPEEVPIQYGGMSVEDCDCNPDKFAFSDPVTDIVVNSGTKQTVEIIIYEKCVFIWEVRVVGWEVSYGAEFVPDQKDSYTVIIQKPTKMTPMSEPVVSSKFKVSELGKILLTIDNPTTKKKRLLYRFKIIPLSA